MMTDDSMGHDLSSYYILTLRKSYTYILKRDPLGSTSPRLWDLEL